MGWFSVSSHGVTLQPGKEAFDWLGGNGENESEQEGTVVSCVAKGKYAEWLTPDGLLLLEGWARDGLTDEQIARNIGIKRPTLYDWCNKYSDIYDALKRGKAPVDFQVENALLKSAIGFSVTLKKPVKVRDSNGAEHIEYADEEVFIQPNTAAQIFWLKNRKKDRWKDKPDAAEAVGQANELLKSMYQMEQEIKDGNMG